MGRRGRGPGARRWARGAAMLLLVAGATVGATLGTALWSAPAQPAPTQWSVTPSPSFGADADLKAVACTDASFCVAVGDDAIVTVAEVWDGTSWSAVPSPSPGSQSDHLSGVACTSSTSCVAVGDDTSAGGPVQTLAELWDGSSWSVVPSPTPDPAGDSLAAVSCPDATDCYAVGTDGNNATTLVEYWDGSSWSVVPTPTPDGSVVDTLDGVSCPSAANCTAVGLTSGLSGPGQTLVESWDGTAWSVVPSPSPGGGTSSLSSVSCVDAEDCVAVGSSAGGTETLVEAWDGTSWSVVPSPDPVSFEDELSGVSCPGPGLAGCTAVGATETSSDPTAEQPLIEAFDGTSWSVASTGAPLPEGVLTGVACPDATDCQASGEAGTGVRTPPLLLGWAAGSWSTETPGPGVARNDLRAVSCAPTAVRCDTVGTFDDGSNQENLAETYDTSFPQWSHDFVPNQGGADNELHAVSCPDPNNCVAVGEVNVAGTLATFAANLHAGSTAVIDSADPGDGDNVLNGVSCNAATITQVTCTAVGFAVVNGTEQTLVESFQPSGDFTAQTSPDQGAGDNVLTAVSCPTATACVAVGSSAGGPAEQTLVESWDGTSWTIVPSPDQGAGDNVLTAVSCPTATACVAVGSSAGGPAEQTLVESWDGTSWTIVPSPDQGAGDNVLTGVTCPSTTDCVAVGRDDDGVADQTLVLTGDIGSLAITTPSLPPATLHRSYAVVLTASGGNPPYTWALAPGSTLPPGLKLSKAGKISGKPTLAGTYSFTVKVTDKKPPGKKSSPNTAAAPFTVTVA